jgi:hypothetical protein
VILTGSPAAAGALASAICGGSAAAGVPAVEGDADSGSAGAAGDCEPALASVGVLWFGSCCCAGPPVTSCVAGARFSAFASGVVAVCAVCAVCWRGGVCAGVPVCVSAARVLGQVQSRASLPFLLEALYDPEPVVRTEVVSTLGALGMPKAIGALIDLGRRYPEVPSSLLAPALTACSFEAQEWSWEMGADAPAASHASEQYFAGMGHQETVVDAELPEWLEDESLADALERLGSADVEARVAAALSLGQFSARRSVEALTAILVRDEVSAVRAAAVTSLGVIDHESVYAPVLFALADESREVRAAAARAYSSVNFDRADAAARLVETADHETLEDLAQACVKSGLAAQSVSRLSSDDRRQAYEAFSLLTLVVRGGQTDPILEAVASHSDPSVQMAAARLACLSDEPRLLSMLRELALRGGLPEDVCAVILEAVEEGARARG